ncbi:hypothetical protein B0H19DRAFT_417377 [Mycena capillaripes]|nr:hypothetical protein B0H19DRAFT_417377 [Mycena capillaripes]
MASRLSRQAFSTTARAARSVRSNVHAPRRLMSVDAAAHHEPFKPKSDMPWIVGAVVIAGPALAYLLRDTFAIKAKIAAGHHGHDSHDAHDAHAVHAEAHEDHAAPAVVKDDEGTEESTSDAAAEPPKDGKEEESK